MRSILITGGSGYFGRAFAKHLLRLPVATGYPQYDRIILFSRGEYAQFNALTELQPHDDGDRLRFFIGDVRDKDRLYRAFQDVDVVVHAAALKRIEVGVYNTDEMVQTNVNGSINVIDAAMRQRVDRVVLLSSDKAYHPVSTYGASKQMAEFLFRNANRQRGNHGPQFVVCRYGNVAGSTGSVIPIWREKAKNGGVVNVTDPDATRFYMRIESAVDLVLNAISTSDIESVHVPDLPAFRLGDLAEAIGIKHMNAIGLPAYEKKHENMDEHRCSETARRMSVQELRDEIAKLESGRYP